MLCSVESSQTRYDSNFLLLPANNKEKGKALELDCCTFSMHNLLSYFFLWLKDITTRVIAREVNLEDTPCSMVMTRNPVFVLTDTLAVEALQKMVQGW
jgi:CBS domain-containing protein